MHYSPTPEIYPQMCYDMGKDCQSCVKDTAAEAAKVCPGLKGKALVQLFVLLYPNQGCAPMAKRFARDYRDTPEEVIPRKPAAIQAPRAKGAAA
jgi:hypothetical protein